MKISINFDAGNDTFIDYPHGDGNFEDEIKKVLKQAEDYLIGNSENEKLIDRNGNIIGTVFRSTVIRPRGK